MDEDLTMEQEWRMVEAARRERARRMRVEVNNREMWVEGRRWIWRGERGSGKKRKRCEEVKGKEGREDRRGQTSRILIWRRSGNKQ